MPGPFVAKDMLAVVASMAVVLSWHNTMGVGARRC